jgi:3-keto-disaccharide hydrolase
MSPTVLLRRGALTFLAIVTLAPPASIEGRWDLAVETPKGPRPSWLEVRHSGLATLVGEFVGIVGSARPISKVTWDDGKFRFAIPPQWEPGTGDLVVEGQLQNDALSGTFTLPDGKQLRWTGRRAPTLRRNAPPTWGTPIPLFNGRDLTGWRTLQGESQWRVEGGVLRNLKGGGNLVSNREFTDFKLHVEVRYPKDGNSGVYLRGRYELQVVDMPGPEPTIDGLGSIYGFLRPVEYAAHGPGEWHALDVTLVGRTVTVAVNGRTVINEREIPGPTGGALDSDEGTPGPIFLQGDHGPVEYRNLVLTPAR